MSKVLVMPDTHGRKFWKEPCKNIDDYERVIFLGDYLDPYSFDGISVEDAIDNFREIISFVKDKSNVVMLLGNHDMPYFSQIYKGFSWWHCRHSTMHYNEIRKIFRENKDLFRVAHVETDVLFTHAGCTGAWVNEVFDGKYDTQIDEKKIYDLCADINKLLETKDGLAKLYMVGRERGGRDRNGSCIWAHWTEVFEDAEYYERLMENPSPPLSSEEVGYLSLYVKPIHHVKQVFGHSIQAYINGETGKYEYYDPIEHGNLKMLDNAKAYELDTEKFLATEVKKG